MFEEALLFGDEGVAGVGVDAVEEVGLFVVVRGEDDVVDYSLQDGVELVWGVFNGFGVEDLAIVLADVEVFVVVFGEGDLLFVVAELEVCDVVFFFQGRIFRSSLLFLFFPLFLFLLELLGRFSWFPGKVSCADFSAENSGLCPVALLDTQSYLFEDELCLLSSLH